MATKKKQDPPAPGGDDQAAKIEGLEKKISELRIQLEDAAAKKTVDPDLVEKLTNRIAGLEEKLEQAEKISKIELPEDSPEGGDQDKGKKQPPKKKSSEGVGMF